MLTFTFGVRVLNHYLYVFHTYSLHEKYPCPELFWSAFSHIRTKYGEYGVSLRFQSECGKMRTRITPNTDTLYAVINAIIHISTAFLNPIKNIAFLAFRIKLRQNVITNYSSFITNCNKTLLNTMLKSYYKLRHLYYKLRQKLLKITLKTYYSSYNSFQNY